MAYRTRKPESCYDPSSEKPFPISRSKIDAFLKCQRCFWLDRVKGVGAVSGPAFSLNSATDTLLKKEFDRYRATQQSHPLMHQFGVQAVPFQHECIEDWRNTFKGIRTVHDETRLLIYGAVDDIWQGRDRILHVVDYKSTSTAKEIDIMEDTPWKQSYRNQMEVYQWLLRRQGFAVSDTGYFVYVNALKNRDAFHNRLEFDSQIIPYTGTDAWVEQTIGQIHACLNSASPPEPSCDCEHCGYAAARAAALEE